MQMLDIPYLLVIRRDNSNLMRFNFRTFTLHEQLNIMSYQVNFIGIEPGRRCLFLFFLTNYSMEYHRKAWGWKSLQNGNNT